MKKLLALIFVVCMVLMVSLSFAQTPRDATSSEGKTTFTNLAVTGLNNNGNSPKAHPGTPAYIEMTNGKGDVYYLYVSYNGELLIASAISVGYSASPCMADWGGETASGSLVGLQY